MAIANITGNILTDSGISTSSLLPLSGGTITGFLTSSKSITTGENGQISIIPSTNTSAAFLQVTNTDGTTYFGKNNNSGSYLSSSPNATLVYSTGSSPIMLYTNGNMIMTLTGGTPSVGGNVLINTTSDNGAKLQVSGAATFSSSVTAGGLISTTVGDTNQAMRLTAASGFLQFTPYYDSTYGAFINSLNSAASAYVPITIQGSKILFLQGNVGIGTTSPSATLHTEVNSSTWVSKIINTNTTTNNAGLLIKAGVNSGNEILLAQKANGTTVFLVDAGGNVGIGTSSPSYKFEVNGISASTSGFLINSGQYNSIAETPYTGMYMTGSSSADGFGALLITSRTDIARPIIFGTSNGSVSTERMRITSGGIINTTSRLNVNGAGDNSLFSFINNGTTYTLGFSPNATASTSTTLTITTATTTWIYNGTGTATWTLPNPSGTNQMFWIKNAGTGVLTLNAFSGTNIINNSATAVSSITIAVGATALIQQDGNVRSYQLQ
jgi:hypothetical protein